MKRYLALVVLISLQACSSADESDLKEPTTLEFRMDLVREATKGGALSFNGGFLILSRFTFDGDRVQGGDSYFDREYEDGLYVPFEAGTPIGDLNFMVPQGTYTEIEVEFEIESDDDLSLQAEGIYTNSDGATYPVVLQLEKLEIFGVNARNDAGNSEVILTANRMNLGNITLNPVHWFSSVSIEELDEAETVDFEGVETILINEEVNEDIYDEVEDRVDELMELVIL